MIVWLNGAFGVGKTATARVLVGRLPGAVLYDPEVVGAALRQLLGAVDPADDFQDLPPWRPLVAETARLLRATYGRDLVVPMTVWRRDYADDLAAGFQRADPDLRRFRLTATERVLRARIRARGALEGPQDWALRHLPSGLAMMGDPAFGEEVATDGRSPEDVAGEILARLYAAARNNEDGR